MRMDLAVVNLSASEEEEPTVRALRSVDPELTIILLSGTAEITSISERLIVLPCPSRPSTVLSLIADFDRRSLLEFPDRIELPAPDARFSAIQPRTTAGTTPVGTAPEMGPPTVAVAGAAIAQSAPLRSGWPNQARPLKHDSQLAPPPAPSSQEAGSPAKSALPPKKHWTSISAR